MKNHHPNEKLSGHEKPIAKGGYKCNICHKLFDNNLSMYWHKKQQHSDEMPTKKDTTNGIKCDFCPRLFYGIKSKVQHISNSHKNDSNFSCNVCHKSFKNEQYLKSHFTSYHSKKDEKFKCPICEETFKNTLSKNRHKRKCHPEELDQNKIIHDVQDTCGICNKKFSSKYLASHIKTKHEKQNDITCDQCDKTFPTQQTLKFHKNLRHKEKDQHCNQCTASFSFPFQLKNHIEGIHEEKNKCDICNLIFKRKQQLTDHNNHVHKGMKKHKPKGSKSHTETMKEHLCHICGKQFFSSVSRNSHIENTHESLKHLQSLQNDEQHHKCNQCDKRFYLKSNLEKHFKRIHQEKNFICELCGKDFLTEGAQLAHKTRIHESNSKVTKRFNNKPQTCEVCNKTFPTTKKYLKHMKESHIGIIPKIYQQQNTCEFCDKTFENTKKFHHHKKYYHIKELNASGLFKCFSCERSFDSGKDLKKHITIKHDDKTS